MSTPTLRICRACSRVTVEGSAYCPRHQDRPAPKYKQTRESSTQRGYGYDHQQLRAWYLTEHPVCEMCGIEVANELHHKVKIKDRPDLRMSVDNLMAVCPPCHKRLDGV